METSERQNGQGRSSKNGPDVRIAGIVCDPGPDAEDRLRRLTAIILKLAYSELPLSANPTPDGGSEEQG